MKSRNLVLALTVGFVLSLFCPSAADPVVSKRRVEKDRLHQRLEQDNASRRLQANKGTNGKLARKPQAMFLHRNKGPQGLLARDNNNRRNASRLINHARTSKLRQQRFFAGRPQILKINAGEKGRLLRLNRASSRLARRGWTARVPFKTKTREYAVAPVGDIGSVRSALHQHLASRSVGALLIEKDAATGQTYRLQHAAAPVTKQIAPDQVAVRCSFYGRTSAEAAPVPVALEYTLKKQGTNWLVSAPQFVSVNGQARPGTFAILEEELRELDTALEEKEFPTKGAAL